jgi:hypothetical protein
MNLYIPKILARTVGLLQQPRYFPPRGQSKSIAGYKVLELFIQTVIFIVPLLTEAKAIQRTDMTHGLWIQINTYTQIAVISRLTR